MKISIRNMPAMIAALFIGLLGYAHGNSVSSDALGFVLGSSSSSETSDSAHANSSSNTDACCSMLKEKPACCRSTTEDCTPHKCCNPSHKCCSPAPTCCYEPCATAPGYCRSFEGWTQISLSADALFWRASAEGLECSFGTTAIDETLSGGVLTATVHETDKHPDFNWEWGWRVGAGYEDICSGWNVAAYWTHLHNHAHKKDSSSNHGSWKLEYDVIDLDVGRDFWVSPCFLFKPFIGLRGADIDEHLKTHLTTVLTTGTGTADIFIIAKTKQKFRGLGPEIGVKADWYLGYGFSFVGMLDFVLLYGNFKIHSDYSTLFPIAADVVHLNTKTNSVVTGVDALLGLRWEVYFSCNSRSFALQVNGEHHALFDFNHIGKGDLDLDGVSFSATIRF